MEKWEYKLHFKSLVTTLAWTKKSVPENFTKNLEECEDELNNLAKDGWELFSSHTTSFNTLVFIFRRKLKK